MTLRKQNFQIEISIFQIWLIIPKFRASRLLAIDAALEKNLTRRARYLSEAIIRDYGTHVLTRVEAGAKIEEEDFVESSVVNMKEENLFEFKSSIAGKFLTNAFGASGSMGMSYSTDSKTNETLSKATRHSHIKTFGGPTVNHLLAQTLSGAKPAEKTQFTFDELVALDVNGVPLYNLISERQMLEIHPTRVDRIQMLLKNATELYYRKNLYTGCTNTTAPNFNYQANSDDGNCLKPYNNYTFGGIFQTCTPLPEVEGFMTQQKRCDGLVQTNGMTGGFSCPTNFDPVVIFDIIHQFPDWVEHSSYRSCHSCWIAFRCCNTKYRDIVHQEKAQITMHYCKAKTGVSVGQDQGYMFGGIFSSTIANPFTGSSNCPGHYQGIRMGLDITICVSRDYQLDAIFNVQFAGFFSCQSQIQKCDSGYSQHLLTVLDGCEIYYCVRPEAFNRIELNPIKRPPFEDISSLLSNDTESTVYIYLDNQLIVKNSFKEILTNISLEMASKNDGKNLKEAILGEDQALNIWLDTMDAKIDEKLDKVSLN
uniref:Macrophage-expressed gene 1 protein n=1 Tax=Panagrolaimus davidi TaxID=227884 RepID=A0A914P478_9BILA